MTSSVALAASDAAPNEAVLDVYVVLDGPSCVDAQGAVDDWGAPDVVARVRARLAELDVQHRRINAALEQRGALVVGDFTRLANAIQVRVPASTAPRLTEIDGVVRVEQVPHHTLALHSALPLLGVPDVWAPNVSPADVQGQGIRVGILDSGIDYYHSGFGGSGVKEDFEADDPNVIEEGTFPTARVVGGTDFVGNDYNASDPDNATPAPDPDPVDCGGHGSHVAGIAAGNGVLHGGASFEGPYNQSYDPAAFSVAPGVAPRADLYALKVFGCGGSTGFLGAGLEWAADPDGDGDMSDRLDVVNGSLGSSYGTQSSVNAQLIKNLTEVGSLFVAAAGNEGSRFFITGSPANYPDALSVAGSFEVAFSTLTVDAPDAVAGKYAAAEGYFVVKLADVGSVTGSLVHTQPVDACESLTNAEAIAGNIAIINRGDCSFLEKFHRIVAAGAIAGIVVNDDFDTYPFQMGGGEFEEIPIPGVMITRMDGDSIADQLANGLTVSLSATRYDGLGAELGYGGSSRGPSASDALLKPEMAAPGVDITSVNVGSGNGPTNKTGTSMAAPMVAGAAALVRQVNPSHTPELVKAVLMNTTTPLHDDVGNELPIAVAGSGRLDVAKAVNQQVVAYSDEYTDAVGLSFGAMVSDIVVGKAHDVRLVNYGSELIDYELSAAQMYPQPGVLVTVTPSTLTLGPLATETVVVTLSFDPTAFGTPERDPLTDATQFDLPRHFLTEAAGRIHFVDKAGAQSLVLPFHSSLRAASKRQAEQPRACGVGSGSPILIPIAGESAHPNPVVSVLELGTLHDMNPSSGGNAKTALLDVRAIGAASNVATADDFDEITVSFGIAIAGEWTTPAQGRYSPVGILIDTDGDMSADFEIVAEAFNRDEPYADVLVATTYDVDGNTKTKRFLNYVPAAQLDTQPFHNGVLVFSVFAHELGLTEDNSTFAYAGRTRDTELLAAGETTTWVDYDALAPGLDASRLAPTRGKPLYALGDTIAVDRTDDDAELLLLHHTNSRNARWEVVSLDDPVSRDIEIRTELPTSSTGERIVGKVVVENPGEEALVGLALTGDVSGGTLVIAAPVQGNCAKGEALDCELGTLAPGDSTTVTLMIDPEGSNAVEVTLAAADAYACGATANHAIDIDIETSSASPLEATGGCSCRQSGANTKSAWWLLAFAPLVVRRLRRPLAAASVRAC